MNSSLLLNSDWSPLNFVSGVRALNLLFSGKAEIISLNEGKDQSIWEEVKTPNRVYHIPATIRLLNRVTRRYTTPRFRKRVLFNRDNWQCQYCGIDLDWESITIDHVYPRSRGGLTTWHNCVASCKKCNLKKGSRTLAETGMILKRNPVDPKIVHFWETHGQKVWHPDWSVFLNLEMHK